MPHPRNEIVRRLRAKRKCPAKAGEYHIVSKWHPIKLSQKQAGALREKTLSIHTFPVCGCPISTLTSLLDECIPCGQALSRVSPVICLVCSEKDPEELIILHDENGEVICFECLGGGPKLKHLRGTKLPVDEGRQTRI